MRIHLPLHPHHFSTGNVSGPLARIGGELVVLELQGQLSWEGDRDDGVVGVLGLDRPDHPTLHIGAHHLLHGKLSTLAKPYAVIRRAQADVADGTLEGDAAEEASDEEREAAARAKVTPKKRKGVDEAVGSAGADEEEDDGPLFPEAFLTPARANIGLPSSPSTVMPSSATSGRGYSSDMTSPVQGDDDEARAERRKRRRAAQPERTRHYEVVGVVRKKVVFALRPEPLVAATDLPE